MNLLELILWCTGAFVAIGSAVAGYRLFGVVGGVGGGVCGLLLGLAIGIQVTKYLVASGRFGRKGVNRRETRR
jgi:hypothetical protein